MKQMSCVGLALSITLHVEEPCGTGECRANKW
jgi:hypothetical protein